MLNPVRRGMRSRTLLSLLALGNASLLVAAQDPIDLGRAQPFCILSGAGVTNTALPTVIQGDVGIFPGTAITGFPPGIVNGDIYAGGPVAQLAQFDLQAAYNDAAGRTMDAVLVAGNLGGQTLGPGLYKSSSSLAISSGNLTLDGQGDPNSVFIFIMDTTFTMSAGLQVILINKAHSANIFWQVGSSATFNSTTVFSGNVMVLASMTVGTGSTFNGRAMALNGSVTLDGNVGTATPPYVSNITTLLDDGTYGDGELIPVQVVFNEPVRVQGLPTLTLNTTPQRTAVYADGDGSTTLTFNYTVSAPDSTSDLDYASEGAFSLAGGSIKSDTTGSDAELDLAAPGTITSLGFNKDIMIETGPPTVLSIERLDVNPTTADTVRYEIAFSEPVNGVAPGNLSITTTSGTFSVPPTVGTISGLDGTTIREVIVNVGTIDPPSAGFRLDLSSTLPLITDQNGNPLLTTYAAGESYTVVGDIPLASTFIPLPIEREGWLPFFTVNFTEEMDFTAAAVSDFTLLRDGSPLTLDGSNATLSMTATSLTINLDAALTTPAGSYLISVDAAGVGEDLEGNQAATNPPAIGFSVNAGDNVDSVTEDSAPNNGDGNDDGILDKFQPDVASIPNAVNGDFITIVTDSGALSALGVTANPGLTPRADPADYPAGFSIFTIDNVGVGGSAIVDLFYESPFDASIGRFFKYGPTSQGGPDVLYTFLYTGPGSEGGERISTTQFRLYLTDGELGDADFTADGSIIDPGAPGVGVPLFVTLNSFGASADTWNSPVQLTWATASEIDSVGFNIYRASASGLPTTKVNESIILAADDAANGATYAITDDNGVAPAESRTYLLESIDVSGKRELFGPVPTQILTRNTIVRDWTLY